MSTPTTVTAPTVKSNGTAADSERMQRALAALAEQEAREAEKARKAAERKAAKEAAGEQPNAAHTFLTVIVDAVNRLDDKSDEDFRTSIQNLMGLVATAADLPNVTTAQDFKVIGQLIKQTIK